jgi:sirohydrochlorin ferrochelatase
MPVYMLVDNGSKQPDATLRLRDLAQRLSEHCGKTVHPVSLQHANAIPPEKLGGTPANTFTEFLIAQLEQGEQEFVAVPLFFGESRALTSFIPDEVAKLHEHYPHLKVKVAPVTYPLPEGDERMAEIVLDHIQSSQLAGEIRTKVVLVDHGSPVPKITEVRKAIAKTLIEKFGQAVDQACMERREGSQYDFNGELLENWLKREAENDTNAVIVAMLFFLPGRHAGPCGDVEEICEGVVKQHRQLSYTITPLIGEHPLLIEILADRMHAVE